MSTCGRGEVLISNIGWVTGGGESDIVHTVRRVMVRIVVCDRGVRRSITVTYVLCCSVGWAAFDVGDTCRKCVESGLDFGELGAGDMSETTAVVHEFTAVFDQLICRDRVNPFYSFVQARGSGGDEVGGSCNAFVHVREDPVSRRDAIISRPHVLIQGVDARAE
jgi:hypothetical protein